MWYLASIVRLPDLEASALHAAPCPAAEGPVGPSKVFQRRSHGCHTGLHVAEGQMCQYKHKGGPLLAANSNIIAIPGLWLSPAGRDLVLCRVLSSVQLQFQMIEWILAYPKVEIYKSVFCLVNISNSFNVFICEVLLFWMWSYHNGLAQVFQLLCFEQPAYEEATNHGTNLTKRLLMLCC